MQKHEKGLAGDAKGHCGLGLVSTAPAEERVRKRRPEPNLQPASALGARCQESLSRLPPQ